MCGKQLRRKDLQIRLLLAQMHKTSASISRPPTTIPQVLYGKGVTGAVGSKIEAVGSKIEAVSSKIGAVNSKIEAVSSKIVFLVLFSIPTAFSLKRGNSLRFRENVVLAE